jgi:hypothetical protein
MPTAGPAATLAEPGLRAAPIDRGDVRDASGVSAVVETVSLSSGWRS